MKTFHGQGPAQMKDNNIQRYTCSGVMTPVDAEAETTTKWIKEPDHLKAIQEEKTYSSGLEGIVREQKKELEAKDHAIKNACDIVTKRNKEKSVLNQTIEAQAKEIERLEKEKKLIRTCFDDLYHSTLNACAGIYDYLRNENITNESKDQMQIITDWLIQKCKELNK